MGGWLLRPSPEALLPLSTVVPVGAAVTADETEVLKAEISKAVKQVQEEGERAGWVWALVPRASAA